MNFYNDIDQNSAAWLRELINLKIIPDGVVDTRSIHEIQPEELEPYDQCHYFCGIGGWPAAFRLTGFEHTVRIDSGSAPCQPFSSAGLKKGFDDKRHLWPEVFRITKVRRPVVLVGEQVSGKDALEWLDRVFADLEGEGYTCGAVDICAAGTGAKGHPVCQESSEFYRALAQRTDLSPELRGACAASATAIAELTVGGPHIRSRLYWVAYLDGGRLIQRDAGHRAVPELGEDITACGLADSRSERTGRNAGAASGSEEGSGSEGNPDGLRCCNKSEPCGPACRVADSRIDGCREGGQCQCASRSDGTVGDMCAGAVGDTTGIDCAWERQSRPSDGRNGEAGGSSPQHHRSCSLVQSGDQRLERLRDNGDDRNEPGRIGAQSVGPVAETGSAPNIGMEHAALPAQERQPVVSVVLPGPSNAWDDFDVIPCLDGKARRAERGTFPLVARIPEGVVPSRDSSLSWEEVNNTHEARKMRLFGYGNALCLPTACAFMDVLAELFSENLRK